MTSQRRPSVVGSEPALISEPDGTAEAANKAICVRVTPSEHTDLLLRAATAGVSVPEYLRRCADAVAYLDALQEAHRDHPA